MSVYIHKIFKPTYGIYLIINNKNEFMLVISI